MLQIQGAEGEERQEKAEFACNFGPNLLLILFGF
jgi:hypothetical protein